MTYSTQGIREEEQASQELAGLLEEYLRPLLLFLETLLDKRLLRTFVQCCVAILRFGNPKQGLLLSELGSYLDGYRGLSRSKAAGSKRVGKLIRSWKWNAGHLEQCLLTEAGKEVERLKAQGKRILALRDGSVMEKAESASLEAIAPTNASKAQRLTRSRLGWLFNPPLLPPIRGMGMDWTGTIITGWEGLPTVAVMRFWTTKGEYAEKWREKEEEVLRLLVRKFGPVLTFVFDRGYASGPWLEVWQKDRVTFILRWIKNHLFLTQDGKEKKIWQIGQGKKYRAHQRIREAKSGVTSDV